MTFGPTISTGMRQMAAGAFFFSLMSLLVKLAGERIPVQEIVLVRGVLTLAITWVLLRRAQIPPLGNRRGGLLLRGFLGFAALSCFYYAVVHLPLAEATVLQYMNPLWAALLGAIYLSERVGGRDLLLVGGSLLGVVLVARPESIVGSGMETMDGLAIGAGLLGGLLSGAAYVGVRELSRTEHPLVIVFYFPLVTVPVSLPALFDLVTPTAREWLLLIGIGVTAQLGQIYITRGLKREPAGRATAMAYLQVVFAGVWGYLLLGESPGPLVIAGSLLILACTMGIALRRSTEPGQE